MVDRRVHLGRDHWTDHLGAVMRQKICLPVEIDRQKGTYVIRDARGDVRGYGQVWRDFNWATIPAEALGSSERKEEEGRC